VKPNGKHHSTPKGNSMNTSARFARCFVHLAALCLAAWLPANAWAFHPLATDDTGTQGLAGNQLEIGYDYAHSKTAGVTDIGREVPFTYARGLTDNLDAFIGVARQTAPGDGWGNVGLGAKWRFYENEASKISLAIKPEITLPVSSSKEAAGFGNGKTSYAVTFITTQETAFGELHFNLAAERVNYADSVTFNERKNRYRISVAPVWAVAEQWKLALDLGLQTNPDPAESSRMGYVELGAVYSPSENFDISFGITRDLMDGPVQSTAASFGLTWRFR
jgi:hypothetical protein